jgi:hypothetical protein
MSIAYQLMMAQLQRDSKHTEPEPAFAPALAFSHHFWRLLGCGQAQH